MGEAVEVAAAIRFFESWSCRKEWELGLFWDRTGTRGADLIEHADLCGIEELRGTGYSFRAHGEARVMNR